MPFFFQNNYSIYELESADKNYHIKGLLMVTPNNNIFIMNSIENISNDDLFNKKLYAYEYALKAKDINLLQDGNILLYEHQKNDPLISLSDLLSKIRIYKIESNHSKETIFKERLTKNQLKLIITYLDYEMNQKEICIKINLKPIYVTYKNRWILFSNLSKSLY